MDGLMAVFMIIFFIIISAVILTGAGIVISTWCFPAEKTGEQQEMNGSSTNDNNIST